MELIQADSIKIEKTDWMWTKRIPASDSTVLCGDPDVGKTTIALELAAQGTVGNLDGVFKGKPFNVLIASVEDSPSHTLVPRLKAAGADLSRVHIIKMKIGDDDGGGLSLPADIPLLAEKAKQVEAKLVIIDPLMSHLGDSLNSNKDQDIRKALAPLSTLAEEGALTVLIICHLNKNESASSKYRIGGSVGIFAVPRSVLLAGEDPDNEGGFVLVHLKCNVGEKAAALRYALERRQTEKEDGTPVDTGGVLWGDEAEGVTADRVLNSKQNQEEGSAVSEVSEWLSDFLSEGAVKPEEIVREAKKMGFSEATLRRAKNRLGVKSKREGFGKAGGWFWRLPPKALKDAQEQGGGDQGEHLCEGQVSTRKQKDLPNSFPHELTKGAHVSDIEHLCEKGGQRGP
jgi:hypothetical protein